MATQETTIKVVADTSQAERALGNLHNRLLDIGKVVIAGAIAGQFAKIAESIDALNKASIKFGIDPAQFNALAKSAELAGIGFDELSAGLQKLSQNIGEALIKNTGPAAAGLAMIGLKASELANLPVDQQLVRVKEALAGIENPALRSAIAMDILGKQGVKILKAAEETDKLRQRFDELGISLSAVDTQGVENALDALTELKQLIEQGLSKAIANIAPYVETAAKAVMGFLEEYGNMIITILGGVTRAAAAFFTVLIAAKAIQGVQAIYTGFVNIRKAIIAAEGAAAAFNLVMGANPIVRIATIVATIAAIFGGPLLSAAADLLGITDAVNKTEEATKKAVEERTKLNKNDAEAARVALAVKQLQLDIEENIIPALTEQVRLAQLKGTVTDAQYETEKLIGEQAKKYNISLEQARKAIGDTVALRQQELMLQNKVNELAGRFKMPFEDAVKNAKDAQAAIEAAQAKPGANSVDFKTVKAVSMANKELQQQMLDMTNAGEAARFAVEQKYGQQKTDLYMTYMTNKQFLDQQGFDFNAALQNMEQQRMLELFALKQKLAQDEVNLNAQKYAMMMSQNDSYYLKSVGGEKAVQDAAKSRAEFEQKTTYEKTQFAVEQGAQMFSALGQQNKKAFEAAKALNIANAIMNTYASVTKALAAYPWPFNLVAAGASLAMGMAQVSQIRSQQYSGRALGGPVMNNTPYLVGENGPEIFTPNTTGSITRNQDIGGNGVTNVNFTIQANDAQGFDDLLNQRRGMITQFIKDAMQEQGQRSRM